MSGGLYAAYKTRGLLSLPWSRDYNCALKISTCIMKTILSLLFLLPVLASAQPTIMPATPQLAAKSYLLYDYTSNQILVNQNGDARMEPASLTKLMTAYLAFDALRHGTLSLEQKLNVPAAAVRNSGDESRMLLKA